GSSERRLTAASRKIRRPLRGRSAPATAPYGATRATPPVSSAAQRAPSGPDVMPFLGTGVLVRHDDLRDGRGGGRAHDDSLQVGDEVPVPRARARSPPHPARAAAAGATASPAGRGGRSAAKERGRTGHTGSARPPQPRTPAHRCRPHEKDARRAREGSASSGPEAAPPPLAHPGEPCDRWV